MVVAENDPLPIAKPCRFLVWRPTDTEYSPGCLIHIRAAPCATLCSLCWPCAGQLKRAGPLGAKEGKIRPAQQEQRS